MNLLNKFNNIFGNKSDTVSAESSASVSKASVGANVVPSVISKTYKAMEMEKDKWIYFSLSCDSETVNLIFNAEYILSHETSLKYEIYLEFLDEKENVILTEYFQNEFRNKVQRQARTKRIMSNPFLVDKDRYLSPNFKISTDIEKGINPCRFRVKFRSEFNALTGGVIRGHYLLKGSTSKNYLSGEALKRISVGRVPKDDINSTSIKINLPVERDFSKINEMFKLYLKSGEGGIYEPPSDEELNAAETLFTKLFSSAKIDSVRQYSEKLNMNLLELKRGRRVYIVVYEKENYKTGKGFYVFCKSSLTRNIALQAPHRFFDKLTGLAAYKLMLSGNFAACAWNSVHRYQTPSHIQNSSDMAHSTNSIYFTFTKAFANAMPKSSLLLQLHGFKSDWLRNSEVCLSIPYDIVLSSSSDNPSKHYLKLGRLMRKDSKLKIAVIPEQNVPQLAGKQNNEPEILEKADKDQVFIHLEMSEKTRADFTEKKEVRTRFIQNVLFQVSHPLKTE